MLLLLLLLTRLSANRPLKLRLLCPTDDRRLPLKHLPQESQQLFHAAALPHSCPVAQIWVVHPPVHAHVLSRSDNHVLARVDVYDGRFLRICLRDPDFEGKTVCRTSEGDGQGAGEGEEEGGGAVLVRVDFGAGREGGVGREGASGGGVSALGIAVALQTVNVQELVEACMAAHTFCNTLQSQASVLSGTWAMVAGAQLPVGCYTVTIVLVMFIVNRLSSRCAGSVVEQETRRSER